MTPKATEPLVRSKFQAPVDRAAVARDWQNRGFSCDLFTDPPGQEWLDFVHETNELVIVLDGKLELEIAGRKFVLDPGDEAFIARGAVHSVRNIHGRTTRWLYGYDR